MSSFVAWVEGSKGASDRRRIETGKLIATTQATVDGVVDPVGEWVQAGGDHAKHVGSNTLSGDLEWNATLLDGDPEDSIPKLKDEVDGDLFMHGSGEFAYALAEKGLIDAYAVYLNPIVWGGETSTCSATGEPSGWSSTT